MEIIYSLLNVIKYLVYVLIILVILILAFVQFSPVFGATPDKDSLRNMLQSKNFIDGKFTNLATTQVTTNLTKKNYSYLDFFIKPDEKNPSEPLPSITLKSDKFAEGEFVWLGHSTLLMKTSGIVVMTDPVFNAASPIPIIGKPFALENPIHIDDLPAVDVVVISHDHYDHLDSKAIKALSQRVGHFFVPLGVKAHLERWGVDQSKISELNWFESENYRGIKFTLAPARHFSGRGLFDSNKTLWGSWIITSEMLNIYFGGDSGCSETFKTIGQKFGPFDIVFMENGAYNENWAQIHMLPEQTVQASIDLNAEVLFPIHWSKFDLSLHPWDEPIIRITQEAARRDINIVTPMIGEIFDLDNLPKTPWWEALRNK